MTKTVMMYSPDSIGLGHVKRNSAIARELVRQCPDINVILLVGSGAGAFFELPNGIDSIKLPSVNKVGPDLWQPRSLSLSVQTTGRLRANLIREAVDSIRPDVLVVDHLPLGVWGELLPTLRMIRAERRATTVVLGLRDILDDPEIIKTRWREEMFYDAISRYYDQVFIYGAEEITPTAELYGLARFVSSKIRYCGYVQDRAAQAERRQSPKSRASLPGLGALRPAERVVFVSAGGGFDAYPMLSASLAALRRLDNDTSFRSVAIAGPLMPAADRARLFEEAEGLQRTSLLPWTSSCQGYFDAADVAIIMGGYNTFLEAATSPANLIMIPRVGRSAEQKMRAELFAQHGVLTHVDLEQATPDRLGSSILEALDRSGQPFVRLPLDGARRAAAAILERMAMPAKMLVPEMQKGRSHYVVF